MEFVETPPGYEASQTARTVANRGVSVEATAPKEIAHASALGDDAKVDRPDSDTFTFNAVEGDAIVLRLVGDPSKGHLGSQARLKLRRAGSSDDEVIAGDVPLRLEKTISESGAYEVVVEQSDLQNDERYRGDYFLVLRPGLSELIPDEDVEQ
ncbi:MAG: hypothetical protein ACREOP_01945 [Thermodesulfobacteriota bacterium]